MLEAGFWAFVGCSSLLIGAVVALCVPIPQRAIGLVMGFGAGVLIATLGADLAVDAFERGNGATLAFGMAAGGVAFYLGDLLIDRRGGSARKDSGGGQSAGAPAAIALGIVLDGVPESAAIGVTLLEGGGIGIAFVAAVFLSNIPESLSATSGLRKAGHSVWWILRLWLLVTAVCVLTAAIAFAVLDDASQGVIAFILAFAAGAILAMLADTMMPEAFADAGKVVALVTVLGFALGFLITMQESEQEGALRPVPAVVVRV